MIARPARQSRRRLTTFIHDSHLVASKVEAVVPPLEPPSTSFLGSETSSSYCHRG